MKRPVVDVAGVSPSVRRGETRQPPPKRAVCSQPNNRARSDFGVSALTVSASRLSHAVTMLMLARVRSFAFSSWPVCASAKPIQSPIVAAVGGSGAPATSVSQSVGMSVEHGDAGRLITICGPQAQSTAASSIDGDRHRHARPGRGSDRIGVTPGCRVDRGAIVVQINDEMGGVTGFRRVAFDLDGRCRRGNRLALCGVRAEQHPPHNEADDRERYDADR